MRGCEKRVIYMKNTGSECFEEAYFVVKNNPAAAISEGEIIKEANRIVKENSYTGRGQMGAKVSHLANFIIFTSGFLLSFLVSLFIFFIRG